MAYFNSNLFFIPYHHIGGAERVHLNIIKALNHKPIVFFDNLNNVEISQEFSDSSYCFLLNTATKRQLVLKFISIISIFMPITLFGSNSGLYYKVVAACRGKVKAIDLTHAFSFPDHGMEITSLPFISKLHARIVINNKTLDQYKQLYKDFKVPEYYLSKFKIIPNGIIMTAFEERIIEKRFQSFTVGYVGRNSPEKRPELFFEMVRQLKMKGKVIGDNFNNFKIDNPEMMYFENCNNSEIIKQQFSEISLLIVPSSREGFPLVIMEAMELGIPVIATDVGSISEHVINDKNGFVNSVEKLEFINVTVEQIKAISNDLNLYSRLAVSAREHAVAHFDIESFNKKYRELFYE